MASIIDLVLFLLALFVVLPGMMIFALAMRNIILHHHNSKHAGWHTEAAGKATW
jgi:hypothetical protein